MNDEINYLLDQNKRLLKIIIDSFTLLNERMIILEDNMDKLINDNPLSFEKIDINGSD